MDRRLQLNKSDAISIGRYRLNESIGDTSHWVSRLMDLLSNNIDRNCQLFVRLLHEILVQWEKSAGGIYKQVCHAVILVKFHCFINYLTPLLNESFY
jgi:hypothetical protein